MFAWRSIGCSASADRIPIDLFDVVDIERTDFQRHLHRLLVVPPLAIPARNYIGYRGQKAVKDETYFSSDLPPNHPDWIVGLVK